TLRLNDHSDADAGVAVDGDNFGAVGEAESIETAERGVRDLLRDVPALLGNAVPYKRLTLPPNRLNDTTVATVLLCEQMDEV
ncbi:hypothetical protein, partial [Escherichia coli]|uniref:hypothetical protein n=1 Tax=Escherichia coli TaxID=562 RepID=UPI003F7688DE|nr:hypothetical protein [Escherichia coli]